MAYCQKWICHISGKLTLEQLSKCEQTLAQVVPKPFKLKETGW